jgi:hypothetical protein
MIPGEEMEIEKLLVSVLRKCLRNIVMYTVLPFETELEENQRD